MFKKLLCLMTALVGTSFSMEQEIDFGVDGNPLIPMVHSYSCHPSRSIFCRNFYTLNGDPIIISIQYMSSVGVRSEEVALKPQWRIFTKDAFKDSAGICVNGTVTVDGIVTQRCDGKFSFNLRPTKDGSLIPVVGPDTMCI